MSADRKPTIYMITAYRHNHLDRDRPVDSRFLESDRNYQFYFVDAEGRPPGFAGEAIAEIEIDPSLQTPGRLQLAEWTFMVAEYRHSFATYPFFITSTRFYEKNERLIGTLDDYWDQLFQYLQEYGIGYLPSYNRDFGFEDLQDYFQKGYLATTLEGIDLVEKLYGVNMLKHRFISDFFCNYIGFNSREDFEFYFEYFLPLLNFFFDEDFREKVDVSWYVQKLSDIQQIGFRNEKPFSLIIEMISHLPMMTNSRKFFGLSYDGFYEVDEALCTGRLLSPVTRPSAQRDLRLGRRIPESS